MKIISSTELRSNQKHYLELAETERIIVKKGQKFVELVVRDSIEEPIFPCQFSVEEMNERAIRGIKEYQEGNCIPSNEIPRKIV